MNLIPLRSLPSAQLNQDQIQHLILLDVQLLQTPGARRCQNEPESEISTCPFVERKPAAKIPGFRLHRLAPAGLNSELAHSRGSFSLSYFLFDWQDIFNRNCPWNTLSISQLRSELFMRPKRQRHLGSRTASFVHDVFNNQIWLTGKRLPRISWLKKTHDIPIWTIQRSWRHEAIQKYRDGHNSHSPVKMGRFKVDYSKCSNRLIFRSWFTQNSKQSTPCPNPSGSLTLTLWVYQLKTPWPMIQAGCGNSPWSKVWV